MVKAVAMAAMIRLPVRTDAPTRQRLPVPRQQLVELVDHVLVDAGDIGRVGLGIQIVKLCGLDDSQGVGEGFAAGIGAAEREVPSAKDNRLDCPLRGIVVDGHLTLPEE